ncbi:hypothetical protein Bca4012_005077 [Brassica carinata]
MAIQIYCYESCFKFKLFSLPKFSERYAEASRRSRGRWNRRRERRRRGFIDEIERERGGFVEESDKDVDSSTRSRERKRERGGIVEESEGDADSSTREREATIPPIETPTDAVDKEISSWRRDHHFAFGFAFGFASREREKTRRLREKERDGARMTRAP